MAAVNVDLAQEVKMGNEYLKKLRKLINEFLKSYPVKIYLFGSRAQGKASLISDVDIAILPMAAIPINLIANLREIVEESTIPYHVDIVDLSTANKNFRAKVLKEGVSWQD